MVKRGRKPKNIIESPMEIQPKIKLQRNLIKVEDNEANEVDNSIENVNVPTRNYDRNHGSTNVKRWLYQRK